MKKLFLLIGLICFRLSAQIDYPDSPEPGPAKYDHTFYLFRTFTDFTNGTPETPGRYRTYQYEHTRQGTKLYIEPDEDSVDIVYDQGIWGFRIDKYTFRVMEKTTPVLMLGQYSGKILYLNGRVELSKIANNSEKGSTRADEEQFYYSDTPESPVIRFSKLPKADRERLEFKILTDCMKEAKKQKGNLNEFREERRCFTDYAEDF